MRIGELAKEAGVPEKTIRYYEEIGLLPRAPRSEGGFRIYGPDASELLQFIRKAQALGLTLAEIRELAEIRAGGNLPCEHLRALLTEKISGLEERIREMTKLRDEMRKTFRSWNRQMKAGGTAVVCPHIEARPDGSPSRTPPQQLEKAGMRHKSISFSPNRAKRNA